MVGVRRLLAAVSAVNISFNAGAMAYEATALPLSYPALSTAAVLSN
jgi:hypothetical protein